MEKICERENDKGEEIQGGWKMGIKDWGKE